MEAFVSWRVKMIWYLIQNPQMLLMVESNWLAGSLSKKWWNVSIDKKWVHFLSTWFTFQSEKQHLRYTSEISHEDVGCASRPTSTLASPLCKLTCIVQMFIRLKCSYEILQIKLRSLLVKLCKEVCLQKFTLVKRSLQGFYINWFPSQWLWIW